MENATSFQDLAESITDPRLQAKAMQRLDEILLPVLCGVVAGCEGFVDIALEGRERPEFLRRLAPFENGIPSHDALSAVFRALDPRESKATWVHLGENPSRPDFRASSDREPFAIMV